MKELFENIYQIKEYAIGLDYEKLKKFKVHFYQKPIVKWQLDLAWEFIWEDIEYDEMKKILQSKKII